MRKNPYRVKYTIKNENGFLVDKSKQFPSFVDAQVFIKLLREGGVLIGKPILEIGDND
jgi:hypothetical protein